MSELNTGRTKADPSEITCASSYSFDKLTYGDIEKMEYSCLIEAETAKSNSEITIKTDKAGYSGEGYIDITDNTAFSISVESQSDLR